MHKSEKIHHRPKAKGNKKKKVETARETRARRVSFSNNRVSSETQDIFLIN